MTDNLLKLAALPDREVAQWMMYVQKFVSVHRNAYNFRQGFEVGRYASGIEDCLRYIRGRKFDNPYQHAMMCMLMQIEEGMPELLRYCWQEYERYRSEVPAAQVPREDDGLTLLERQNKGRIGFDDGRYY